MTKAVSFDQYLSIAKDYAELNKLSNNLHTYAGN